VSAISPFLLQYFSYLDVEWSPVADSEIVSIGSVLEHIPSDYAGYIVGSGKLKESSIVELPEAKILALRGPLSAKDIEGSFAIGDPGLLANELVGPQETLYDLGIVPHWRDKFLVERFKALIPKKFSIKVIDPRDYPLAVVAEIGQCERIVTSSLHGMILADAFNKPRRVELADILGDPSEGGDFKFRDYSASIGVPFEPGRMVLPPIKQVEDAKFEVFDAFKELEDLLWEQP